MHASSAPLLDVGRMAEWLAKHGMERPEGALVLGSGWGPLVDRLDVTGRWSYADLPGLPSCTTKGHAGELVAGRWAGVPCVIFVGRWHTYEGLTAQEVAMPSLLAHAVGARWMLLTNAAGGMDPRFEVGHLVAITADIGLWSSRSMLNGAPGGLPRGDGPVYDAALIEALGRAAAEVEVPLDRGVLAMMSGANYESAAEIAMLRRVGAQVVSMSTVPEARAARMLGMRVAALSCVTNRAPSVYYEPLDHDHVLAALTQTLDGAGRLIEAWLDMV